jgi:hypothetical protein
VLLHPGFAGFKKKFFLPAQVPVLLSGVFHRAYSPYADRVATWTLAELGLAWTG